MTDEKTPKELTDKDLDAAQGGSLAFEEIKTTRSGVGSRGKPIGGTTKRVDHEDQID